LISLIDTLYLLGTLFAPFRARIRENFSFGGVINGKQRSTNNKRITPRNPSSWFDPLLNLPYQILIFSKLDYRTVGRLHLVCRLWNQIIDQTFWKELVLRDLYVFFMPAPLLEESETCFHTPQEVSHEYEQIVDGKKYPDTAPPKEIDKGFLSSITNWRECYHEFSTNKNLNGYWIGDYGSHGEGIRDDVEN
jgi:hypothetical protein